MTYQPGVHYALRELERRLEEDEAMLAANPTSAVLLKEAEQRNKPVTGSRARLAQAWDEHFGAILDECDRQLRMERG